MRISFDEDLPTAKAYDYLTNAIGPRPIALVSSLSQDGVPNLAPFSFFNLFSIDPPIMAFSPLRRMRDNTTKHTFENCVELAEVVIHIVTYERIHQVNLCSHEYDETTDEFIKAGFTKEKATMVKPWMIKEIPVKFECKIIGMQRLGAAGGAGTICLAKILVAHIDDQVLDENKMLNPNRLQLVARMGGNRYTKVTRDSVFELPKPSRDHAMGFDRLPSAILESDSFNSNQEALLASLHTMPEFNPGFDNMAMKYILELPVSPVRTKELYKVAAKLLNLGMPESAWQVILRTEMEPANPDTDTMNELYALTQDFPVTDLLQAKEASPR